MFVDNGSRSKSRGLIVLGMHRSGTSMVSGVLGLCGAWLGTDDQMTGSNIENPKGFFERRDLRSICDSLLYSAGADWWRLSDFSVEKIPPAALQEQRQRFGDMTCELGRHGSWAIKEPRLCMLLSTLKPQLEDPICVIPIRNPLEIAKSLRTRNQFSILHGLALWEIYMRSALFASEDCERVFVHHSSLMCNPKRTTQELLLSLERLGVTDLRFSNQVAEFISPELHRETAEASELEALLDNAQLELWKSLTSVRNLEAQGRQPLSARTCLLLQDLECQHDVRLRTMRELKEAQADAEKRQKSVAELKAEVDEQRRTIRELKEVQANAEKLQKRVAELKAEVDEQRRAMRELKEAQANAEKLQKRVSELKAEVDEQRRAIVKHEQAYARMADHLSSELDRLQREISIARTHPFKSLKRKLTSKLLFMLSDSKVLFSSKRRAKFHRSALKRDPARNEISRLEKIIEIEALYVKPDKGGLSRITTLDKVGATKTDDQAYSSPMRSTDGLVVIVPIHNAPKDLEVCVARLCEFTPTCVEILLIDDASTDPAIEYVLEWAVSDPRVRVIRNLENLGFTATVNRGLREAAPKDAVILNSDARVTPGWVEGILRAANSKPHVATVTPMSDRAGAFSAPNIGNDNVLPPGVDEITYSRAFRQHSFGSYPEVPTGNGFCMFIGRDCLDAIGDFDEKAFPRGYGEENDFCMRALRAGWVNLIDDRTYVFHDHAKSFGDRKAELMAAGRSVIDERYPDYKKAISVYRSSEKISNARLQALRALQACSSARASKPRVLFVISTVTGGTPQTNLDLMNALESSVSCFLMRCDSHRIQLWEHVNGERTLLQQHDLREFVDPMTHVSLEYDQVVADWLASLDLDVVHIRHPAWHSLSLAAIARQNSRAVVMSFHDYYTLCPTVNLLDNTQTFCGGMCTAAPGDCQIALWRQGSMPKMKNSWVHVWRKRFANALQNCDAFVTTSSATRARLLEHMPELTPEKFHVIPHGRDFREIPSLRARPNPSGRIKILIPGNINEAKGIGIIKKLLAQDTQDQLEFHLLGKQTNTLTESKKLINHGQYSREDFMTKVEVIRPHLGAVFSIWDETWCHTLTEMWSVGVPVAVFDFPTVSSRVRESGAGWVLDHTDISALYFSLLRIARDTDEFQRTEAALQKWKAGEGLAGNTRWMASDYFDLYSEAIVRAREKSDIIVNRNSHHDVLPTAITPRFRARVAVVGPADAAQISANGSTEVRLWERTLNTFDRAVNYVRLRPEELLASLQTGNLDAAIIQRNALPASMVEAAIDTFATTSTRWILELDDNLLDVPASKDPQGRYAAYAPALRQLIAAADTVTVSTEVLREMVAPLAKNVEVLPNRLSARLWRGLDTPRESDEMVRALYMGSTTHAEDLEAICTALDVVAKANPHFRLGVIGITDGELPSWAERIEVPKGKQSYHRFVPWLRQQASRFDFAIAPLVATSFNAFKSPLKLLEYGALGLPILASDHPVYRELGATAPGVHLVPDGLEAWTRSLEKQIKNRREGGAELRAWVLQHHSLEPTLPQFDELVLHGSSHPEL